MVEKDATRQPYAEWKRIANLLDGLQSLLLVVQLQLYLLGN